MDPVTGGGGTERTLQMSRYLSKSGHQCTILTTDYKLSQARINEMKGVELIVLPCLNKRFYIPVVSINKIIQIVKNMDIIHLMAHWSPLNALVYYAIRLANKPYVVCPVGTLPKFGRSKTLKRIYDIIIGRKIIKNANAHIAVTSDETSQFKPYGVNLEKIRIIPNGIVNNESESNDDTIFRKKYGLSRGPFILFVGRLNPIKGPDLLLKAFCNVISEIEPYHLVIAGPDNGMLSYLKAIAASNNVKKRVHFIGYVGGRDKFMAYHASELLVIPSRQESMSIVVLEAGITGTPVLLTDQCGVNEIENINGGKIVPATVKGLEEGLIEMLYSSDELKEKGVNLKKYISNHFLWDSVVTNYIKLYEDILQNGNLNIYDKGLDNR